MGAFFSGLWGKILAGGAIVLGILIVIWRVLSGQKQAGVDQERAKQQERINQAGQERRDIDQGLQHNDQAIDDALTPPDQRGH